MATPRKQPISLVDTLSYHFNARCAAHSLRRAFYVVNII
jgi:hypothetical protein